jgi:hypothetical protein
MIVSVMTSREVKIFWLFVFSIIAATNAAAQKNNSTSFYRHFTGKLDTSMHITLDLLSQNGKISGFYYYYFPEPGNNKVFRYGKTIPVQGNIDGNVVGLTEFSTEGSSFNGVFNSKNKITGTWQRNPDEKSIPFSVTEDYSGGSLPFSYFTLSGTRYLNKGEHAQKNSPKARISLVLLYPDLPHKNPLKDSLDFLITKYLHVDTVPFKNPELLLENITFDFFDSYYRATDGIEDISKTSSFNWEKNITMEVYYNENNIVSLKIEKYAFTGGAHGINITQFIVCDLKQQKLIDLKDIMKENYKVQLDNILNEKLRKMNGIKPDENLKESGFFADRIESSENFYINRDGIGFYYNIYHIAPFSAGTTELFLTYNELREILNSNPSFFWNKDIPK